MRAFVRRVLLGIACSLVVVVAVIGQAPPASAHSQDWEHAYVQNVYGQRCLAVQGVEHQAFEWDCVYQFADQRWSLQDVGYDLNWGLPLWRLVNWYHGLCLAVRGSGDGTPAAIGRSPCA